MLPDPDLTGRTRHALALHCSERARKAGGGESVRSCRRCTAANRMRRRAVRLWMGHKTASTGASLFSLSQLFPLIEKVYFGQFHFSPHFISNINFVFYFLGFSFFLILFF